MSKQTADGRSVHDAASSILSPGTLCTIIAGCPENIGLIVEVVSRLGAAHGYNDGYRIRTTSGRYFAQPWQGLRAARGASSEAFTERWKLRPLVAPPMDQADDLAVALTNDHLTSYDPYSADVMHRLFDETDVLHE